MNGNSIKEKTINIFSSIFFQRILRFEFWPLHVFYIPMVVYYIYRAIKQKDILFYTRANNHPALKGFVKIDKYSVYNSFPEELIPKTHVFDPQKENYDSLEETLYTFPLIVKPSSGYRGKGKFSKGIQKINTFKELITYLEEAKEVILIQEYIDLPLEFGVFYIRMPHQQKGNITSLMQRKFLSVVGDGESTLKKLIEEHERAKFYSKQLYKKHQTELFSVLQKGEEKILVHIGNHCRGTEFRDVNYMITPRMEESFDTISLLSSMIK